MPIWTCSSMNHPFKSFVHFPWVCFVLWLSMDKLLFYISDNSTLTVICVANIFSTTDFYISPHTFSCSISYMLWFNLSKIYMIKNEGQILFSLRWRVSFTNTIYELNYFFSHWIKIQCLFFLPRSVCNFYASNCSFRLW